MAEECIHISDLRFHLKFNKLVLHSTIEEQPVFLLIECEQCESVGQLVAPPKEVEHEGNSHTHV